MFVFILFRLCFEIIILPITIRYFYLYLVKKHHYLANHSLRYRLFTLYDFFDSIGKFILYTSLIVKFTYLLRNGKLVDLPKMYLFICRSEFFLTYGYVRLILFKIWRSQMRLFYFIIVFPFIFLFKYFICFLYFYFEVFALIEFILYLYVYIKKSLNYVYSFFLYSFFSYIKNLIAFMTFFDFHFTLIRGIYF